MSREWRVLTDALMVMPDVFKLHPSLPRRILRIRRGNPFSTERQRVTVLRHGENFKRAKFRTSERQRNSGSERNEHTGALAPIASLREHEGISRERNSGRVSGSPKRTTSMSEKKFQDNECND